MPSFEEFLAGQTVHISAWGLLANMVLAAVFSYVLSLVYNRYGSAISNRKMFSRNFVLLIMTTTLVITIIKSSLALSLGLVGALSIVRFRAAIKEPEELAYLFLAIALGLGLGADQRLITTIAFAVIVIIVIFRKRFFLKPRESQNLHIAVSSHNPEKIGLSQIVEILNENCSTVNLKRFDESGEALEASFLVSFSDYSRLEKTKEALNKLSETAKITFLDTQGQY